MKISAVQFQSVTGDITSNLAKHLEFIKVAVAQGADLVFFPELSLIGYEPKLGQSAAWSNGGELIMKWIASQKGY